MIEKLHMEKYVESFVLSAGSVDIESPDPVSYTHLDVYKRQVNGGALVRRSSRPLTAPTGFAIHLKKNCLRKKCVLRCV